MAADQLAALIRIDQNNSGNTIPEPSPGPITGPLDVGFAIDSTGSMGGIISQVESNVTDIASSLQGADSDLQVGLIDYKDAPPYSSDPYQAQVDVPLTTDLNQFDTAVNGLSADGGGDTPESVYTGMMTTLGLSWRSGAHKEMIVIGDAGGHDVDPVTGYTEQDVVQKALSLDPVAVNVIPASSDADATFAPVAAATGGSDTPLGGDAATAIKSTIQAAQTAPIAGLGGPYTGFSDAPITLSAGESYSPMGRPLTFGWDFNDDGTVDQTTTTPTVSHTFGDYDGLVTLKITDSQGQSAVAQAQITASGNAPAAPTPPGTPTLAAGDQTVTATWTPGSGGGPADLYELQANDGTPVAYVIPSGPGAQSVQIAGFTDGQAVSLSVVAINATGQAQSGLSAAVTPQAPSSTTTTTPTTPPATTTTPVPKPKKGTVTTGELAIVNLSGAQVLGRLLSTAGGAHVAQTLHTGWVASGHGTAELRLGAGRYRATVQERHGHRTISRTLTVTVSPGRLTLAEATPSGRLTALSLPAVSRGHGLMVSAIAAHARVGQRLITLKAGQAISVTGKVTVTAAGRPAAHLTVHARRLVIVGVRGRRWLTIRLQLPG